MLILKDDSSQVLAQSKSDLISVGREDQNTVQINHESISGYHGIFFKAESLWVFRDNFSTNGSHFNGKLMRSGQIKLIRDRDIIRLSDYTIKCELTDKIELKSSVTVFKGFDVIKSFEIGPEGLIINSEQVQGLASELNFSRNEIGALSLDLSLIHI